MGFLFELFSGKAEVQGFAWQIESFKTIVLNLVGTFLIFGLVGWSEELVSRGYHLQTIMSGSNSTWAVALSSVLFAAMHFLNSDGITLEWLFFYFLGGILFAYAYLTTGQLWLAIGLHTGWDYFVNFFYFASSISGLQLFHLIQIVVKGPRYNYLFGDLMMGIGVLLVFGYSKIMTLIHRIPTPTPG